MTDNASDKALIELSQLRWHCRRGVKELDVVLRNYLDNHYLDSNSEMQNAFKELLNFEDPILLSLVMDYQETDNDNHNIVLEKMKTPYS